MSMYGPTFVVALLPVIKSYLPVIIHLLTAQHHSVELLRLPHYAVVQDQTRELEKKFLIRHTSQYLTDVPMIDVLMKATVR